MYPEISGSIFRQSNIQLRENVMSKKVLVNLDMNKNQLENVVIHNLATDPATGTLGQVIYNTAEKQVKQWNGSAWKAIGSDVDTALSSTSTNPVQNKVINTALANKVDKVSGKVLSSNDYTDAEKQQLASLVAGTITVDSELSDSSENPVQNKVVKAALDNKLDASLLGGEITPQQPSKLTQAGAVIQYVGNQLKALPKEQFLDLTKTTFVQSFAWSSTTYPNSTNPNLDGKPVMVLALKNSSDDTVAYSFLNMYELVDTYTGTSPITVSGRTVSHANSNVTVGSYGLASNATPSFGDTFNVPYVTVDAKGHVTAASTKTVTVPNAIASAKAIGLMSPAMYNDLIAIGTSARRTDNIMTNNTTAVLSAGETSLDITLPTVSGKNDVYYAVVDAYVTIDNAYQQPVIVDWAVSGTKITVSIAKAVTFDINIELTYYLE